MKINDLVAGVLIGSLATATWLHARTFPQMPGQNVGPNMFPQLIAAGLMICAVLLVVRGLRTLAGQSLASMPQWLGANRATAGFAAVPLALAFYVLTSERLGFIPTAALLLLGLFLVFSVRMRTALIVSVIGALGIHTMFYQFLKVPLPWGVLAPLAW